MGGNWQELEGRNYQNLPGQVRKILDRRYLSFIVLLQETAESLEEAEHIKKIVFQRLNSGGEELTPQETRNALYNGKFNQLCLKLSQNDYFRKMWKFPLQSEGEEKLLESESYRKMEDVELVLRFFAYRHLDEDYTIKVGDMLIIQTKEGRFYKKHILTIQLDNIEYHELAITEKTKIAVSVDHKIKDNYTFYIVRK